MFPGNSKKKVQTIFTTILLWNYVHNHYDYLDEKSSGKVGFKLDSALNIIEKLKRSARCYNFLLVITHSHSHLFWLERHFCSAMCFFSGRSKKSEENALFGFFDNLGCLVPNAKNGLKYFVKYYYVFSFQDNYRSCGYPLLIINCSWLLTVLKAMVRIKYWNWPSKSGLKIYKPWLIQMAKTDKSEIIWKISMYVLVCWKNYARWEKTLST